MRRDEGESGVALILVDDEGENVIVVAPGANGRLEPSDVVVGDADAVLCQLEIPVEAVAAAAEQASFLCLNAAPAVPVPAELIRRADLVVVNRFELDALAETPRLTALTLGAEGAVLLEAAARSPAPPRRRSTPSTAPPPAMPSVPRSSSTSSPVPTARRRCAGPASPARWPPRGTAPSPRSRPQPRSTSWRVGDDRP